MSDPKYLTDDGSEATDLERELLLAAQDVRLAAPEKQAIWAGVALQCLPVVAPPAALSGAGSKLGLSLPPLLKGLVVVAGLGGASAGAYWLTRAREPAPRAAVAPALASAQQSAAVVPSAAAVAAPAAATVNLAAPTASSAVARVPSVTESQSALRDESSAVLEIRRTLRAGDASGALRLLEQARQRFPHGALSQEREALSIEALAKSGASDAASRKAEAFLRAHPRSPYAADLQSFISH